MPCNSELITQLLCITQLYQPAERIQRVCQVAASIAKLAQDDRIQTYHLAEALQYYPRANW